MNDREVPFAPNSLSQPRLYTCSQLQTNVLLTGKTDYICDIVFQFCNTSFARISDIVFFLHFEIVSRYKTMDYNMNVMRQTARIIVKPQFWLITLLPSLIARRWVGKQINNGSFLSLLQKVGTRLLLFMYGHNLVFFFLFSGFRSQLII